MPEAFHFQHPQWFWLLLPLLLLWWRLRRPGPYVNPWRRACDARLLPHLLVDSVGVASRLPVWLLAGAWLLAVTALADPVWDRQPQPVFRSQEARVVVLDLSRSMLAADLPPSRLLRARYKVADILDRSVDGQTGLVVFAGDAFAVAPLSNDTDTIRSLLAPLEPALMPVQGSRVDLGLAQATALLRQAGLPRGDVLLLTDGYDGNEAVQAAAALREAGYRLSVLGIGTADGAPLADGQGGYLRDAKGNIVMPGLDVAALRKLAAAGGGRYVGISDTDADIRYLLDTLSASPGIRSERTDLTSETWRSRGPWLVMLLLPLAALVFRRGWLLVLVLQVGMGLGLPRPAMAMGWDDLWLRPDQQAIRSLQAGAPEAAAQLAEDPALRGTGAYLAGDYEQALEAFAAAAGADGDYNQGNSLARLGRYTEAIAAYERALKAQPDMEDAAYNKAQIEKLLQQQQQSGQQGGRQQEQQHADQEQPQSGQSQAQQGASSAGGDQGQESAPQASSPGQPESGQGDESGTQDADTGQAGESGTQDADAGQAGESGTQNADAGQDSRREAEAGLPGDDEAVAGEAADAGDARPAGDSRTSVEPQRAETSGEQDVPTGSPAASQAAALHSEERQATEQWLRRIPDDPGGLLRRKFLYQYRQRGGSVTSSGGQAW